MTSPTPEFLLKHQYQATSAIARLMVTEKHPSPALKGLTKAIEYSVAPGGKYVRSILLLGAASTSPKKPDSDALDHLITAIELIHTYSLVHDDLPVMDDDDMRRGKPSLHKAYDEATAVLVGDGLQARAFELLVDAPGLTAEQKTQLVKVLAQAAGGEGMVGGQYIDIQATGTDMTPGKAAGHAFHEDGGADSGFAGTGGYCGQCHREATGGIRRIRDPHWPRISSGRRHFGC